MVTGTMQRCPRFQASRKLGNFATVSLRALYVFRPKANSLAN
jgi:hypothetical protein